MLPLILRNKQNIIALCKKYDVKTMYLVGSAATGEFNELSDIDILISFKEMPFYQYTDNFFELHEMLEMTLGRKVDLVTDRSLSNPYFIRSLEETKQLLYAA